MTTITLTRDQEEVLMRAALVEAELGMAEGEVPIGALICRYQCGQPRIVARGHNRINGQQRRIAHAEIVAFDAAAASAGTGPPALPLDADDVILVSTLEPCVMCTGAAMEAGVRHILYGLAAPADSGTGRVRAPQSPESSAPTIAGGVLARESRLLFERWLAGREDTDQAPFVKQLLMLTSR